MQHSTTTDGTGAGWYATGRHDLAGEWDGAAWTGRSRAGDPAGAVAPWRVRPFAFLAHPWFWSLVVGLVLVAWAGFLGDGAGSDWWKLVAAAGMLAILSAVILFFDRLLHFGELPRLGLIVVMGLVSGAVANLLAYAIEPVLEPALGVPFAADLWLSGPVEETSKLALPLLLLLVARRVFGDPRAGVLMVLLSSAAFGVWEGFGYVTSATGENGTVLAGLVRGVGEIPHPLWTAIAASLIWLAAHRAGRAVTLAGFVGWLIAVVFHSLHDGIGAARVSGTGNTISQTAVPTIADAIVFAALSNVVTVITIVVALLIVRHVARELVPPAAIATNPPRWRPRLKLWGVPRRARAAVAEGQVAPAEASS
ncbi:PrsW family glutamic-type intramembrane protease [Herbiconiux sp. YIM B11900]|uniref:PrsW family glutamic-type intramembrane protease n=1 Tax=Herbiconiux sp. YIM B11900 TaxID=3404131 RepID=UPI003F86D519